MVVTKYSYESISVDLNRFSQEIADDLVISIALDHVYVDASNNLDVWFKAALSGAEKAVLDGIVNSHVDTPLPENESRLVEILEESVDPLQRTGGHFQARTLDLTIPAGTPGAVTSENFSWPHPVSLLDARVIIDAGHAGDTVDFCVAPDTIIGIIVADVAAGDKNFRVSQTVLDNTFIGAELKLLDGTNTNSVGRVLEFGYNDGYGDPYGGDDLDRLRVETGTINSFTAATPTYVQQTVMMIREFMFPDHGGVIEIGASKIGASYLPADTIIRIDYANNDGVAKKLNVICEYLY